MDYKTWNKILCDYFFYQREAKTFLSIDKEGLLNVAMASPEYESEFGEGVVNLGVKEKRTRVWNDFLHIFCTKTVFGYKCSKSDLLAGLQYRISQSASIMEIPTIFPYIALFVIPLSNDPNLRANAFYPRVNDFLINENLIGKDESLNSNDMRDLHPGLDFMWNNLTEWAIANDYIFSVSSQTASGRAKYAEPFISQLIFNASQRENLKLVFYHAGLTPSQDVTKERAINIISGYYQSLGISKQRWDLLKKDYIDSAIEIFLQELNSWDGMAIVTHRNEYTRRSSEYLGAIQNLVLEISTFRGRYIFGLRAKLLDASFGEDFTYKSTSYGEYKFSVDNNGLAQSLIWNPQLSKSFINGEMITFVREGDIKVKLVYSPGDIELLELSYGSYITAKTLQAGRKYFVLVRKESSEKYKTWLSKNEAQKISQHELSESYDLFKINKAISDIPTSEIKRFKFEARKTAELVSTISLGRNNDGIVLIYKNLPAYFKCSGVDVSSDHIYAFFNSEGRVDQKDLFYDEDSNLWILPKISNIFMQKKRFQIYCNDTPISSIRYMVSDFNILDTDKFKEIKFNSFGEYDDNGIFDGLKVNKEDFIPWKNLTDSMQREGHTMSFKKLGYENSDFILYYLSTRPRCEKKDLENIVDVLIQNKKIELLKINKWAIRNLIDNYFRMGYINYSYLDGKHIIAVNRPTLLLLPPKVEIENPVSGIKRIRHKENFWTVLLSGARTPNSIAELQKKIQSFRFEGDKINIRIEASQDGLMPQSIYLMSNSLNAIKLFAEKYGYEFKKCIYSNLLLKHVASVKEYLEHVLHEESYERYDGIGNVECLDYKELEYGRYKTSSSFSKEMDVVSYFPGTFREKSIIWKEGKQYPTDKHWGHLIGMMFENAKVILYDKDNKCLKLPVVLQLPLLYARALTLISGNIPEEKDWQRTYEIYENPYANTAKIEYILEKLAQK